MEITTAGFHCEVTFKCLKFDGVVLMMTWFVVNSFYFQHFKAILCDFNIWGNDVVVNVEIV